MESCLSVKIARIDKDFAEKVGITRLGVSPNFLIMDSMTHLKLRCGIVCSVSETTWKALYSSDSLALYDMNGLILFAK